MADNDDEDSSSEEEEGGKKRKSDEGGGGAPGWMTTFSDLMSLLLTFFVLLVSMSHFDPAQMDKVMGSLSRAFSQEKVPLLPTGASFFKNKSAVEATLQLMRQLLDVKEVVVTQAGEFIEIRIPERFIFYPNRARLREKQEVLSRFVQGLLNLPEQEQDYELQIEGLLDTSKVGHYAVQSQSTSKEEMQDLEKGTEKENLEYLAKELDLIPENSAGKKGNVSRRKHSLAAKVPLIISRLSNIVDYMGDKKLARYRFVLLVKPEEEQDLPDDIIFRLRVHWSGNQQKSPFKE